MTKLPIGEPEELVTYLATISGDEVEKRVEEHRLLLAELESRGITPEAFIEFITSEQYSGSDQFLAGLSQIIELIEEVENSPRN